MRRQPFAVSSTEQIDALRHSDGYRELIARVTTIGQNLRVTETETGDAMGERMKRYGKVLRETL